MTLRQRPASAELVDSPATGRPDDLLRLLRGRQWVALTGAGMSTDSGIPDYRGPNAPKTDPMMFDEFMGSDRARRRYWARSMLGWHGFRIAAPNEGHRLLADHPGGLAGIVTQNVDGLHQAAGSSDVIDLHGRIDQVICTDCGDVTSRADLQPLLEQLNPTIGGHLPAGSAELAARLRPDGDAVVDDWEEFAVPPCQRCGGVLKPDVVFFGESVNPQVVRRAYDLVNSAEVLVVLGSSLTVMSGLRFVRHAAQQGRAVAIVNRGATRGDELAAVRIDASISDVLAAVLPALALNWPQRRRR